ncbi:hypothetical protein EJB05_24334 [Eragrostis curvula]|uniref:Uncharacterized protein n=1 Tax=Eragrostis curvula TaxID=38414 RepID=A0A5J9VB04_9POAL|nr:hypothetical protein EJB05_24334 [Eragrostis curvula]
MLGLERVMISEASLHGFITGSPVLDSLLLKHNSGFDSLRINSPRLTRFGLETSSVYRLVIEDAPLLQRLVLPGRRAVGLRVSVISAPKLETLGPIYSFLILPALPQSSVSNETNLWRRKHRHLIRSLDIRLKTIVLTNYRGIMSQVNFATFFVLNAKLLEVMRFEGGANNDDEMFIAKQRRLLQIEKRVSLVYDLTKFDRIKQGTKDKDSVPATAIAVHAHLFKLAQHGQPDPPNIKFTPSSTTTQTLSYQA